MPANLAPACPCGTFIIHEAAYLFFFEKEQFTRCSAVMNINNIALSNAFPAYFASSLVCIGAAFGCSAALIVSAGIAIIAIRMSVAFVHIGAVLVIFKSAGIRAALISGNARNNLIGNAPKWYRINITGGLKASLLKFVAITVSIAFIGSASKRHILLADIAKAGLAG